MYPIYRLSNLTLKKPRQDFITSLATDRKQTRIPWISCSKIALGISSERQKKIQKKGIIEITCKNQTTQSDFKPKSSQDLLFIPVEYSLRNSYTTLDMEIMVALIMWGEPAIPATTNSRNDVRHSSKLREGAKGFEWNSKNNIDSVCSKWVCSA